MSIMWLVLLLSLGLAGYALLGWRQRGDTRDLRYGLALLAWSALLAAGVPAHASRGAASGEKLSDREREILRLVATGHTSCEIGKRLGISDQTVNTHIKNMYRKLQVRTRAQAVNLASMRGLL